MARKAGMHMKSGYVVIAVPESGLFVKDGRIVTGHETTLKFDEMILFSREFDAKNHANAQEIYWKDGDVHGHKWTFPIIPVLVSERL